MSGEKEEEENKQRTNYPRYFLRMLTVDGENEGDAMEFAQQGFSEEDGVNFCLVNGSYNLVGETMNVNLSLETFFFTTEKDRDIAHGLASSIHEELQTYHRSKSKELYYVPGCYSSAEEEEKANFDAEAAFLQYRQEEKEEKESD